MSARSERAARSGGQLQPTRPPSVMGPRSAGRSLDASVEESPVAKSAAAATPALAASASAAVISARRRLPILTIVPRSHEEFLRALVAVILGLLMCVPTAALADTLTVGAVRDQDGAAIAGARVTAVDAAGRNLAADRTAIDGTFAVSSGAAPSAVIVVAPYARAVRAAVSADGSPVIVLVLRSRAADAVPSAADVAALPSASLSALASVVPYRVAGRNNISDAYFDRGAGAVTLDGLPFYRRGDGANATPLAPTHAVGALTALSPDDAALYGDRGGGGLIDGDVLDGSDAVRLDNRDLVVRTGGSGFAATLAHSYDDDGMRTMAAVRDAIPFTNGSLTFNALAGSSPLTSYDGLGAQLRMASAERDLRVEGSLTSDAGVNGGSAETGSVAEFSADLRGRGPDAVLVQLRTRTELGTSGDDPAAHRDSALVLQTERGSVVRVAASVAFADGSDGGYASGAFTTEAAILPSLTIDAPLSAQWSLHGGYVTSTLGTPGFALARAALSEAALRYADGRGFLAEFDAFDEHDGTPQASTAGLAASVGWSIAPHLSLRSWLLRDSDAMISASAPLYYGDPVTTTTSDRAYRRNLVWLTYDAPTRIDLLLRGGALEGSLRAPVGRRTSLTAGVAKTPRGVRQFDAGLAFVR